MHLKPDVFTEVLIEANGLDPENFQRWAFFPGMRFNSPDKWWGDFGQRDFPHEGVDLCLYQDKTGQVRRLASQTRIPVMHDGVVKALFTDFLGQAVIMEHEGVLGIDGKLLSVYAHTNPEKGIAPGATVRAGEVIATIADTRRSKANILPHLHLSCGVPSLKMAYDPFVWDSMRDPDLVALFDPLSIIAWPDLLLDKAEQRNPGKFAPA